MGGWVGLGGWHHDPGICDLGALALGVPVTLVLGGSVTRVFGSGGWVGLVLGGWHCDLGTVTMVLG